ncbi:MAG: site-specific DNA-methyltransferase [Propionibacteriaceae bacterium]|nr:site-specific DNA-methyltransferase [Propionibacteriaceae bacterium]
MPDFRMLLSPSANHVYRDATPRLAAAELEITAGFADQIAITSLGRADALRFSADDLDELALAAQSSLLVGFEESDGWLRPLDLPNLQVMDDDLVTIPKYPGKTNEAFTRLLLHLTLSQVSRPGPLEVLDPLAGRGTTLLAAWQAGHHGFGVEADEKAFDALASYLKTYLRTKRIKHSAQVSRVRREGRSLGRRLDAEARLDEATHDHPAQPGAPRLKMTVFTGDTRDSATLFGRKRFDAIVTDAPYGVVHGAEQRSSGQRGSERHGSDRHGDPHPGGRDRSPSGLLAEAIPIWRSQLKPGGALGISWNTYTLSRDELLEMLTDAGLHPFDDGPWLEFEHRVDSSINRDLVVAITD